MSEDHLLAASSYSAGAWVGGYLLEEQIGHGGMAVVFRARDEKLDRQVALKILAPALAADEAFRRRFVRESRAAAAVDDPHIIPVFEAGDADGALFIAMRYVRGGDLRSLLFREGPLDPDRVASIISPVASALDAAHGAGLVHRDVKPANILLDARPGRPDHVYLSDFGLSKTAVTSVGLTATGLFLGTVDYASPEQVRGNEVDGQADQYALACTAFEMLCGEPPFSRDHAMAVMLAHQSAPPPRASALCPRLPAQADEVLGRALAKSPADRYATCGDFSDALRGAFGLGRYDDSRFAQAHMPTELAAIVPPSAPAAWYAETPADGLPFPGEPRDWSAGDPATGAAPGPVHDPAPVPPAGPPQAPRRATRRRSSGRLLAGAALAGAVIAAGAIILVLHPGSKPSAGRGGSAPAHPNQGSRSAAYADWKTYHQPGRFSIRIPPGWSAIRSNSSGTEFTGPVKGFVVVVAWTAHPKPDALTDWRQQARADAALYPTYHQILIRSVTYRSYNAADWAFTQVHDGTQLRYLDRGFIVDPGKLAYAIELYGPSARWPSVYRTTWRGLVTSFKPA